MLFMTIVYVVICIFLVLLVLLQQGKGAGMGIIGGGSDTILGSNAGNVFTKATSWMATMFILGALVLSVLSSGKKPVDISAPQQSPQTEIESNIEEATTKEPLTVTPEAAPATEKAPAPVSAE